MELPSGSTKDPLSNMVDKATFHLTNVDERLCNRIKKLGFQIIDFDGSDLMVFIKHPSSSVLLEFLKEVTDLKKSKSLPSYENGDFVDNEKEESVMDSMFIPDKVIKKDTQKQFDDPQFVAGRNEEVDHLSGQKLLSHEKALPESEVPYASASWEPDQKLKIGSYWSEHNFNKISSEVTHTQTGDSSEDSDLFECKKDISNNKTDEPVLDYISDYLSCEKNTKERGSGFSNYEQNERCTHMEVKSGGEDVAIKHTHSSNDGNTQGDIANCLPDIPNAQSECSYKKDRSKTKPSKYEDENNKDIGFVEANSSLSTPLSLNKKLSSKDICASRNEESMPKNTGDVFMENAKIIGHSTSHGHDVTHRIASKEINSESKAVYQSNVDTQDEEKLLLLPLQDSLESQKKIKSNQNTAESEHSFETIHIREDTFRKINTKFKDHIGYFAVTSLKTNDKIYSVSVKKSHFDEVTKYVTAYDKVLKQDPSERNASYSGKKMSLNKLYPDPNISSYPNENSENSSDPEKRSQSRSRQNSRVHNYSHENSSTSMAGAREKSPSKNVQTQAQPDDSHMVKLSQSSKSTSLVDNIFEKRFEGLKFQVREADFIYLKADVLVSPANRRLEFSCGLSKIISDSAGSKLQRKCEDFIKNNKGLEVTEVFISPGGNLSNKEVFHAVSPKYNSSVADLSFDRDLRKTILTCLMLAVLRKHRTIAFPFISGSTLESLEKGCFKNYLLALMSFDSFCVRNKFAGLESVTFVDKNTVAVQSFIRFCQEEWYNVSKSYPDTADEDVLKFILNEALSKSNTFCDSVETHYPGAFVMWERKTISRQLSGLSNIGASRSICGICCDSQTLVDLKCCENKICRECIKKTGRCPYCRQFFAIPRGNQPDGIMTVFYDRTIQLPGFEGHGTYMIKYDFQSGMQGENHPNHGHMYHGTNRTAYIPATKTGFRLLTRLFVAFKRRLIFTIDTSLTTGKTNSIVWNGIHHKTSLKFSKSSFSYPDPGYLQRLDEELTEKGVTFNSFSEAESKLVDKRTRTLTETSTTCLSLVGGRTSII